MPGPDQLLADADWLRRLALALAGSPDDAEDLLQESRIAAWRAHPMRAGRCGRGWPR